VLRDETCFVRLEGLGPAVGTPVATGGRDSSDGDGDRAARGIVSGVDAGHAATASVTAAERVEVEVRITRLRQPTAASRARDRRAMTVAHGDRTDLGV